ncbi:hypothetical protein O9992_04865 [Vibrio lentus]|nr:hypothetical protein [Vibrio lentus]
MTLQHEYDAGGDFGSSETASTTTVSTWIVTRLLTLLGDQKANGDWIKTAQLLSLIVNTT